MSDYFKIHIKSGDTEVSIESSNKQWVETHLKNYKNLLVNPSKSKTEKAKAEAKFIKDMPDLKGQSTNEFYRSIIKKHNITARPNIATFFIYYLQKIVKKDKIKTGDVQACFGEIGFPKYNTLNFTDILNQAKRKALLNQVNNFWTLTVLGEDYILNTMTSTKK